MPDDAFAPDPTIRALLKIRLELDLDGRTFELNTCSRHERGERVRQALGWQVALLAFEKRHAALTQVPEAAGFISEDSLFVGTC